MSDFSISTITSEMVFFADSLFTGLKVMVPVLYLFHLLNRKSFQNNLPLLFRTSAQLLILGGLLFIFIIGTNVIGAVRAGNEAERDMMIAFATGSHWYQFFLPLINFVLLPVLLWFEKLRRKPDTIMVIISWWIITGFVTDYLIRLEQQRQGFHNNFEYTQYFLKIALFVVVFTALYGIGKWQLKHTAEVKK